MSAYVKFSLSFPLSPYIHIYIWYGIYLFHKVSSPTKIWEFCLSNTSFVCTKLTHWNWCSFGSNLISAWVYDRHTDLLLGQCHTDLLLGLWQTCWSLVGFMTDILYWFVGFMTDRHTDLLFGLWQTYWSLVGFMTDILISCWVYDRHTDLLMGLRQTHWSLVGFKTDTLISCWVYDRQTASVAKW